MKKSKRLKWAKGLNKELVSTILSIDSNPYVEFMVEYPEKVTCTIAISSSEIGVGRAICSILDQFNEKKGKNKAAGRAVRALVSKNNNDSIRSIWEQFPDTWSKKHIDRVLSNSIYLHKSAYIEGE